MHIAGGKKGFSYWFDFFPASIKSQKSRRPSTLILKVVRIIILNLVYIALDYRGFERKGDLVLVYDIIVVSEPTLWS